MSANANAPSELPIQLSGVAEQRQMAKSLVTSISYTAQRDLTGLRKQIGEGTKAEPVPFASMEEKPRERTIKIIDLCKNLGGDTDVLDEDMSVVVNAAIYGTSLGLYMAEQYDQFSGLRTLRQTASTDGEKREMTQKIATQAAIGVHVAALFVLDKLKNYKKDELAAMPPDFPGLPETIPLVTKVGALTSMMFHWGSYLEAAQSSLHAVKITQLYFNAVLDEIKRRSAELKFTEAFTSQRYRLPKSDFVIDGFKGSIEAGPAIIDFPRMEKKQIIGNKQAKALIERLVQFAMAYDFVRKMNPAIEIGGFPWNFCLAGFPGTGKTMLLQLMMTLMLDYTKQLGIPFGILDMPSDIKAGVQGESAARYAAFCRQMDIASMLLAVLNDDCEVLYPDRRGISVDEGSRGIIMTHIRFTQGATSNIRGNVLWGNATNNPHLIDPAVYSRFMAKVIVPGAETEEDFARMLAAFQNKTNKLVKDGKVIDLQAGQYAYLAKESDGEDKEGKREQKKHELVTFKNTRLVEVYDEIKALQGIDLNQYALYAKLFAILHARFEGFTSRDVSNITQNVMLELFGHNFPKLWLEDKDAFISKDYDTKKEMIVRHGLDNLTAPITEVMWNQTANYVESSIEMLDSGRKKRIEQKADEIQELREAEALAAQRRQPAKAAA